jgi:hypothetical protein
MNVYSQSQLDLIRQICTPCEIAKTAEFQKTAVESTDYSAMGSNLGQAIGGTVGSFMPGFGGAIGLWGGHLLGTGIGALGSYMSGNANAGSDAWHNLWNNRPSLAMTALSSLPGLGAMANAGRVAAGVKGLSTVGKMSNVAKAMGTAAKASTAAKFVAPTGMLGKGAVGLSALGLGSQVLGTVRDGGAQYTNKEYDPSQGLYTAGYANNRNTQNYMTSGIGQDTSTGWAMKSPSLTA